MAVSSSSKDTPSLACVILSWPGRFFILLSLFGLSLTLIGKGPWYLQGAAYWPPLYIALALAGAVLNAPRRAWRWILAGVLALLLGGALLLPLYLPAPNAAPYGNKANLTVLQANVYEDWGDPKRLHQIITKEDPDVLLFQEYKAYWLERMKELPKAYPHYAALKRYPDGDPHLGQYHRFEGGDFIGLADQGIPAVRFDLKINGQIVTLLNVHTAAPFSPDRARRYARQMEALIQYLRKLDHPVMVFGDLNSAPWSPLYKRLIKETGLISARQGRGLRGAWPAFFGPLRTSIDHALVSPEITVISCRVGPGIHSDHRPLITKYYIAP